MNMRTQILVVGIALIFLVVILQQVRKQKLGLRYALLWILLSVSILVMGCFPKLITVVSRLFGIQTPVNMPFFAETPHHAVHLHLPGLPYHIRSGYRRYSQSELRLQFPGLPAS